jgi:protein ImuB
MFGRESPVDEKVEQKLRVDRHADQPRRRATALSLRSISSDVPERSVGRVTPTAPPTGEGWPQHWPRPSRLFASPEPIETVALLPDRPPVSFTWRGIRRRVKRADGPERVFGEWWKRDAELIAMRDYFQVEDEAGERFWIFRAGDGEDVSTGSHRWFLHGIFA